MTSAETVFDANVFSANRSDDRQSDSAKSDSAKSDSAKSDSAKTDSVKTDSVKTDSVASDRTQSRDSFSRFTDWLLDTAPPKFGLLVTWLLCVFAILLALSPIEFSAGVRSANPATIFAWLPEAVVRSGVFFFCVRVLLGVSAVCWMTRVAVPVSCWTTTLAFTLMWALRMENLTNGAHIFTVTNMLMFINAMWFHFYADEIKSATVQLATKKSVGLSESSSTKLSVDQDIPIDCYPRWVFLLSVFYLGWFHTLAGLTKIINSGFGWGNGVSLQLWTELFGDTSTPFAQTILFDTRLTAVLQTGALVIECTSILCVFHRWVRYAIGVGLTGFYVGVLTTFVTFGFHFNAVLVAIFLLPVDWWMGLKFSPSGKVFSGLMEAEIGVFGDEDRTDAD